MKHGLADRHADVEVLDDGRMISMAQRPGINERKDWKDVVSDIGITCLYPSRGDELTANESHNIDIVFVHGVLGHPWKTWRMKPDKGRSAEQNAHESDSGAGDDDDRDAIQSTEIRNHAAKEVFWPGDLLPRVFDGARILTWGYDVKKGIPPGSGSHATLLRHSETLLADLAGCRTTAYSRTIPIIFIAHSLGGVVVKDAMSIAKGHHIYSAEILDLTKGIMFLGTPHRGCRLATGGKMLASIVRSPLRNILGFIEQNSEHLDRLNSTFNSIAGNGDILLHSFQEELPSRGVMVVPEASSSLGLSHETRSLLHGSHRSMVKIRSLQDSKFQRITSVLIRWIEIIIAKNNRNMRAHPADGVLTTEYQNMLDSLKVPEANDRFDNIESAFQGTYEWLFHEDVGFTQFLTGVSKSNIFWIQGKPASGKSTAMKFAIVHKETQRCLQTFDGNPWIVLSHFFHDRGTQSQKSLEGFLLVTLHRLLSCRRDIFPFVFPAYDGLGSGERSEVETNGGEHRNQKLWSVNILMDTFLAIRDQLDCHLNICAFVDALDEHEGADEALVTTLSRLETISDNPLIKLRICMASRPENLFRTKFKDYPGLVIDQHTAGDIKYYAETRIWEDIQDLLLDSGATAVQKLINTIIARGQGVFLWIKLVIEEIVEGIQAGDTISEMEELLLNIPQELSALYARTMRRQRRRAGSVLSKLRHVHLESYMIFHLVLTADPPLNILSLLYASTFLASGKALNDLAYHSPTQLEYRLHTLSRGLLESHSTVQFLHQTTKMFFKEGEGRIILCEQIDKERQESGDRMVLRVAAHSLKSFSTTPGILGEAFTLHYLISYGKRAESNQQAVVGHFMEAALSELSPEEQHDALLRIAENQHESSQVSLYINPNYSIFQQLCMFYALFGLCSSLEACLSQGMSSEFNITRADLDKRYKYRIIEATFLSLHEAMPSTQLRGRDQWEFVNMPRASAFRILRAILYALFKKGLAGLSRREVPTLSPTFHHVITKTPLSIPESSLLEEFGWCGTRTE